MSHGKRFEGDMLTSLRSLGHWAERFTDRTFGQGNMSVKSPPDMVAVVHFQPWLMELKAQRARTHLAGASIPLSRVSQHQLDSLLDFDSDHGNAYVMVMFYEGSKATKRIAVQIPIWYWEQYPDKYRRKSVTLEHLTRDLKDHIWDWVGRGGDVGPWLPRLRKMPQVPSGYEVSQGRT